jgi:hypothetical protein
MPGAAADTAVSNRRENDCGVIVDPHNELAIRLLGNKQLRFESELHIVEGSVQGGGELLGTRRRCHALGGADKKLIL